MTALFKRLGGKAERKEELSQQQVVRERENF